MITTYHWVAFWADCHHKVRLIHAQIETGELGGALDRHLARYCEYLDSKFPGSEIIYSPETNPGNTASYLIDLDTNEYLLWAAEQGEDLCVI
ncbi:MAG: hypothetical protein ACO4AJ_04550 [Prochlorothrix sp.]